MRRERFDNKIQKGPHYAHATRGASWNSMDRVKVRQGRASPTKLLSETERKEPKHNLKRRAAIDPVSSNLKSDHRLARNYLKGVAGNSINLLMATCAFNFKTWPATLSTCYAGLSVDQLCYFLLLSLVCKKKLMAAI